MQPLTLEQAQYIAHRLAIELLDYTDEPIPPFETRYPHILESCLNQPFQEFSGEELYPGIHLKAAVLFYLVIKNHPFKNGNKRMAVTLTLTFLYLNGYTLNVSTTELYDIAMHVASSSPSIKEDIIKVLHISFEAVAQHIHEDA